MSQAPQFSTRPVTFDNRYAGLGEGFYTKSAPASVESPGLIICNQPLAEELGLAELCRHSTHAAGVFSGNLVPTGAEPLAMAYAGHQFGNFVPRLGDGRALLLGQVRAGDGKLLDIHLKGSGPTVYSRNGDGRAALGPVLREYLVSEAMARLGVPTTRALAAVTTGEEVVRERLLPGGVITRVAEGFVRVGTFEYFRYRDDLDAITCLADYVIDHYYPATRAVVNPYIGLLEAVIAGQATLIARWMQLGFIHGVMNTDNMSITGQTIDYGPCAFMDAFAHDKVFSSIDRHGRYAYNNQPSIGLWNLARFAETLLPLLADASDAAVEIARDKLDNYIPLYQQAWLDGMRAKIGLRERRDDDKALIDGLFDLMAANRADFTLLFYHLSTLDLEGGDDGARDLFEDPQAFDGWALTWRRRLRQEASEDAARQAAMRAVNPVYIPRNHQVEAAIRAAEDHGDFSVFHALNEVLQQPRDVQPGKEAFMQPPAPHEVVQQTFCGT